MNGMDANEDAGMRIQDEADRWFARLMAPGCDTAEHAAFERWRQVPAHAQAYAWRQRLWQRMGESAVTDDPRVRALRQRVLARTAAPAPASVSASGAASADLRRALDTLTPRQPTAHRRRARRWPLAIAAGMCALVVGVLGMRLFNAPPEAVYVAADTLREVTLDDGTRLQLDVQTELAVHYDRATRSVVLRRGRALFEVAHDAGRPFTVDLGDSRITVLGTRFQALRSSDRVSVTLADGALRLDAGPRAPTRSERLRPGEQVSYPVGDPAAWTRRSVDGAAVLAWARGRLVFRATPLAEAVQEVNRYATPRLRLADPALAGLPVSGNFIAGDSALVAETWAATLPLRAERRADEIVLRRRD